MGELGTKNYNKKADILYQPFLSKFNLYSTVTLLAKFLGLSTSTPLAIPT